MATPRTHQSSPAIAIARKTTEIVLLFFLGIALSTLRITTIGIACWLAAAIVSVGVKRLAVLVDRCVCVRLLGGVIASRCTRTLVRVVLVAETYDTVRLVRVPMKLKLNFSVRLIVTALRDRSCLVYSQRITPQL